MGTNAVVRLVAVSVVDHDGYNFCKWSTYMYHVANCRVLKDGVISGTDYLE
jgi:hypothetical protein